MMQGTIGLIGANKGGAAAPGISHAERFYLRINARFS
jgi:hypothetical protein